MKIKMNGFDSHNLLAFLALLGTLKALETSKQKLKPRMSWEHGSLHLHLNLEVNKQEIAQEVISGVIELGKTMKFHPHKKLKITPEEFDELQNSIPKDIIAALGCDGILDKDEKNVAYPPLCTMFGAGQQYFLERLENATSITNEEREKRTESMYSTLFDKWKYNDDTKIGFRWDPNEYRPHAYRSIDPSRDTYTIEDGANRLAAIGFMMCWCVPTLKGLEASWCTDITGSKTKKIAWPIWKKKMSLSAILIIMRHPYIKKILNGENSTNRSKIVADMNEYGIECVMATDIFWDGQFRNVRLGYRVM